MKTENIRFDVKICLALPYLKELPLYCFNNQGYTRKSKFNSRIKKIKESVKYCFGGNNILNVSLYPNYYHNLSIGFYETDVFGKKKYHANINISDLFGFSLISIEVPLKNILSKIDKESYDKLETALRNYHSDYRYIQDILALNHKNKLPENHLKKVKEVLIKNHEILR